MIIFSVNIPVLSVQLNTISTSCAVHRSSLNLRRNPRAIPAITPEKAPRVNLWVFMNEVSVRLDASVVVDVVASIDVVNVPASDVISTVVIVVLLLRVGIGEMSAYP